MCREKTPWERAVEFHGHTCMGLAVGFRVAEAALQALGNKRDVDEEMVAVVENDSCAVDAIQVITGCTVGKGNMILRDYGKHGYTFALRKQKKAVRVLAKFPVGPKRAELMALRQKVSAGEASKEEQALLQELGREQLESYFAQPLEEVCEVKEVPFDLPEKARIFPSVTCASCGEEVMEPRARLKNGKPVCLPCAEKYGRGWGGGC